MQSCLPLAVQYIVLRLICMDLVTAPVDCSHAQQTLRTGERSVFFRVPSFRSSLNLKISEQRSQRDKSWQVLRLVDTRMRNQISLEISLLPLWALPGSLRLRRCQCLTCSCFSSPLLSPLSYRYPCDLVSSLLFLSGLQSFSDSLLKKYTTLPMPPCTPPIICKVTGTQGSVPVMFVRKWLYGFLVVQIWVPENRKYIFSVARGPIGGPHYFLKRKKAMTAMRKFSEKTFSLKKCLFRELLLKILF